MRGLHAVALYNQVEVVLGIFNAGILFAVVLLKGKGAVTGAHRAHNGDKATQYSG